MVISRRLNDPKEEVWALVNAVSIGRPLRNIVHIVSVNDHIILGRSDSYCTPEPDILYYPVKRDHALGQLVITPDTLIVIDETNEHYDSDWFDILKDALLPFETKRINNDLLDRNNKKISGVTQITNLFGMAVTIMLQCKGPDVNNLLAADKNKKHEIGTVPYTLGEAATRIEAVLNRSRIKE